jgi:hypothetical protein
LIVQDSSAGPAPRSRASAGSATLTTEPSTAEDRGGERRARVLVAAWEDGRRDPGVAGPGDRAAHAATACTPESARSCCRRIHSPIRSGSTPSAQDKGRESKPRWHIAIDDRQQPD